MSHFANEKQQLMTPINKTQSLYLQSSCCSGLLSLACKPRCRYLPEEEWRHILHFLEGALQCDMQTLALEGFIDSRRTCLTHASATPSSAVTCCISKKVSYNATCKLWHWRVLLTAEGLVSHMHPLRLLLHQQVLTCKRMTSHAAFP